jgi:hypothetical protein
VSRAYLACYSRVEPLELQGLFIGAEGYDDIVALRFWGAGEEEKEECNENQGIAYHH